jgi:hypothetical protein
MKKEPDKNKKEKDTTAKFSIEKKGKRSSMSEKADQPLGWEDKKKGKEDTSEKIPNQVIRSSNYQHPDDPSKKRIQFTLFQKGNAAESKDDKKESTVGNDPPKEDSHPIETIREVSDSALESAETDNAFAQKVHSFHAYDDLMETSEKATADSKQTINDINPTKTTKQDENTAPSLESAANADENNFQIPNVEPNSAAVSSFQTGKNAREQLSGSKGKIGTPAKESATSSGSLAEAKVRGVETPTTGTEHKVQKEVKKRSADLSHKKAGWIIPAVLGALVAGLSVGGGLTHYWNGQFQGYKSKLDALEQEVKTVNRDKEILSNQLEDSYIQLQNVQVGLNQMNKMFTTISDPPNKPHYRLAGEGVILYWLDGMLWRKYHVYEARGKNGSFKKLNKRSTKKTFMYLDKLKKGTYRYVITALDREGNETDMSETLEIKIKR